MTPVIPSGTPPAWAGELAGEADPELVARVVRLAATTWATPERIRQVVDTHLDGPTPTAAAVVETLERLAAAGRSLADEKAVAAAARALAAHRVRVRIPGEPGYPPRLLQAWPELGAPLWLFEWTADGALPDGPAVAVVGTRHPTLDGVATARELAAHLARHGVTVVSGMARGIDQAAHLGAIEAGGRTVGVLGAGFGVDYPRRDGAVRQSVWRAGGLLTELLPGTPPRKRTFLWRNRIIAGLSDMTVVVEGRSGSGALHTARMAISQGRDVMAVPGPVRSPTSRAPLDLIRDGATPLTRIDDVTDALGIAALLAPSPDDTTPPGLSTTAGTVLPLLGASPAQPAALAAQTGATIPAVMAAIAELTARGLAAGTPRGVVRVRP